MANVDLKQEELNEHLKENINFLKISSESFDSGFVEEAKRLAVTIRVLLHDTPNSKSILGQLNIKDDLEFHNTANEYNPKNITETHGLVVVKIVFGNGISYKAPLEESKDMPWKPNNYLPFSDWWNAIVIKDNKGIKYTRKELVMFLANKDGGAHVDPKIDKDFYDLKKTNRMSWEYLEEKDGIEERTHISQVELHSMRQITYELIVSLENL